ncbi:hypothetical protein EH165_07580 [Nakamurella antarctica]|uniref:Carbon monoxide dehydrogenase subunit G n=1 Tax=Nakamurella antarctica TaxID=1902245 RepID=A0A3G8ZL25_9ACTN|nr:SRPBCC family protein [Nakamurella antarctica]AZI58022.1 hypothetical protein EH165_07580 [Nakamurella antarctica]
MITVEETLISKLDAPQAFAYLREFEHTMQWDPGTPVVRKISEGPAAVGSKYYAEAEFRGKRQPIEYVVTEIGEDHIQLRGENKTVISVDTITVLPSADGATVTYRAEFSLKGILKVAEPFMKGTFQKLAKPAIDGMRTKLDSMVAS